MRTDLSRYFYLRMVKIPNIAAVQKAKIIIYHKNGTHVKSVASAEDAVRASMSYWTFKVLLVLAVKPVVKSCRVVVLYVENTGTSAMLEV